MYAQLPSHVQVFVTLLTIAHQGPLSMEGFRQECWSGLQFPLCGIFPTQGQNSRLWHLLHWRVDSLPLSHLGSPKAHGDVHKYMTIETGIIKPTFLLISTQAHRMGRCMNLC